MDFIVEIQPPLLSLKKQSLQLAVLPIHICSPREIRLGRCKKETQQQARTNKFTEWVSLTLNGTYSSSRSCPKLDLATEGASK